MSVPTQGRTGADADGGHRFERIPPQDLDAEQSVLGGMMLSKDAIDEVTLAGLKGSDFYRPAHETIFNTILELTAAGEPADPITVAAALTKSGQLTKVGGASYLHTLVQAVPTAANAEYYGEIVYEAAIARRLVEAGTAIAASGYARDGDAEELVERAQERLYTVARQRGDESLLPASDGMDATFDDIEAAGKRKKGELTGVPTGFIDLDSLTLGLQPGAPAHGDRQLQRPPPPRPMPDSAETGTFQAVTTARCECLNGACGSCERNRAVSPPPPMKGFCA